MSSRKILKFPAPVVGSLVHLRQIRTLIEIYSPSLRKLWKKWDLRITVLLSLVFQLLLGILGRQRKHNKMLLKRVLVWSAYITADSIATFSLGILLNNLTQILDDPNTKLPDANTQLTSFWAPFLLFHLGGPDTITAYALEDNELWSRHLFGLVVHTGMTLFVMLMSWTGSNLSVLFLIMFISGLIKYGEQTWVRWSACKSKRRESSQSMRTEGICKFPLELSDGSALCEELNLRLGYHFLNLSKLLMVDATVDVSNGNSNYDVITKMSAKDAFKVIEIELGLMFDLLYTKAPLLYTRWGLGQRLITSILTCSVLVLFSVHVGAHFDKYSTANVFITFLLIIIAVMLDIYSALLLLFSDRFLIWLIQHKKTSIVETLQSSFLRNSPRWSNSMSQSSLLSFATRKVKPQLCFKSSLIDWNIKVTNDVRKLIYRHIKQKADEQTTMQVPYATLPTIRGFGDQQHENNGNSIIPSTDIRGEFEKRIVIFHIATEVLYHLDKEHFSLEFHHRCKQIKGLSRYMLYLLKEHPAMLSAESSQINFKAICNAVNWYANFLPGKKEISKAVACETLHRRFKDPAFQCGNFTDQECLLKEAMNLAQKMHAQGMDDRWMTIENSWLEILGYAARRSKVDEHAQMLRRGGEFLTHVWLLLAHFGLTSNFQIIP